MLILTAVGLGTLSTRALGQETAVPAELAEVTVRSTLLESPLELVPASVTVVDGTQVRDRQWQVNLSESLSAVPGLLLQNRQNYAQDLQLSIRGQGARSTFGVRGIQIYVDGIPSTMPDGQGQTSNIDLASVERIEVLRGPYSALYGNASGGVINIYTERGEGRPEVQSSVTLGSNGQKRLGLKAKGESHGVGYVVSISRYLTDGYRPQSGADKNLFNARLDTVPDDDSHLMLVANHTATDARDPGGVTPDEWRANSRAVVRGALDFGARKSVMQTQAGLAYERRIDGGNALRLMVYAGRRETTQYQATPVIVQKPTSSAGGVIALQRDYGGLDLRWAASRETAAGHFELAVGLAANITLEDRKGYNNFIGNQYGVMGSLRRDERNTLSSADPYAQASWAFAPAWKVQAGVRWSNVSFESRDRYIVPGNGDDSGRAGYHRLLPVVSLQHQLDEYTHTYTSLGSGFETPTFNEISYRPAGLLGLNFGLQPAVSTSAEVGIRQRLEGERLRGEWAAALFQIHTQDEIVAAENAGGRATYQNAGRTRRQGMELSATAWLTRQLKLQAALTLLDARLRDGYCDAKGNCIAAGRRIAGTAKSQAYLGLDWRPMQDWSVGLDWRQVGRIAANDDNSVHAPSYGVAGLSVGHVMRFGAWTLNAFARLDNVADRKYVGSVIVNETNGRYYEAAPGRQWMAGMNLAYQF
ncbi:TonB-dependent receptor family protein [Comamonas thiooxydans]